MKGWSKILPGGASTLPLLLAGLLTVFILSRKKKNISAMEYDLLIQKVLTDEGYSPNTAKYFAAVSRHETGNYSSNVLKTARNLFGMKFPVIRDTTAKYEDRSGYAVYSSAVDSVFDLVLYLNARDYPFHFPSVRALVTFMKEKKYFEADLSEYLNGVESALQKIE